MSENINQYDEHSRQNGYWQHYWMTLSHNPKQEKRLSSAGYYLEGKKHGMWTRYDSLGNITYTGTYNLGQMIDLWQWLASNGDINKEELYIK